MNAVLWNFLSVEWKHALKKCFVCINPWLPWLELKSHLALRHCLKMRVWTLHTVSIVSSSNPVSLNSSAVRSARSSLSWWLCLCLFCMIKFNKSSVFSTWPTVAYNPKSSEDRKHTMRSQKSQLYCTFIIHLFVERGTFSMKVLLPVQERWCEIQNRRCKHVGNSFTLLSVPSSIRWVTPPHRFHSWQARVSRKVCLSCNSHNTVARAASLAHIQTHLQLRFWFPQSTSSNWCEYFAAH